MGKETRKSIVHGIRLPHNKHTQDCETSALLAPPQVTLLMAQHTGAPATACVNVGDKVQIGTLVGKASGFISANVHASVSGTVSAIQPITSPSGATVQSVVIDNDYHATVDPTLTPPVVNTADELVAAIAQSGLIGLGGAGFPTHVKFAPPKDSHVDTLVVNGAECEPYITSDYREMLEHPDDIVAGVTRVKELLGLSRAIIGIEDNKPQAIELLRQRFADTGVEIIPLGTHYPQGAEKVLIANLTGRVVPAGKLPSDVGVIIVNISTISFVAQYLRTGMPLVATRVTVDGDAVARPGNVLAPVGTRVKDVVKACGGYSATCAKLLMGGPMMGIALYSDEYPLQKNNNGILAFSEKMVKQTADYPCIRCGRCVLNCPVRLSPAEIQVAYATEDPSAAEKMGVLTCIECGCCTYVCPAKRPITQIMRLSKAQIRKAAGK